MNSCGLLGITYSINESEIVSALKNMSNRGFSNCKIFCPKNIFLSRWAGSPKERLQKFYDSWNSEDDIVFFIKGGSGTDHVISKIDFKSLKNKEKTYVGYSDATPLLNAVTQYKKNISLHGPMALKKIDNVTLDFLKKALSKQYYEINFRKSIDSKKIVGVIAGGNLSRLVEYTYRKIKWNFKDKIIFLEDTQDVSKYRFINLVLALKTNHDVRPLAIVLGHMRKSDVSYVEESLRNIFPNTPIIPNVPFGHALPNITIPIGANCEIDFEEKKIKFLFSQ